MMEQLEHPDITRCLRTGYPGVYITPVCPVCGADCARFYKDQHGDIFACDECVKIESVEG